MIDDEDTRKSGDDEGAVSEGALDGLLDEDEDEELFVDPLAEDEKQWE